MRPDLTARLFATMVKSPIFRFVVVVLLLGSGIGTSISAGSLSAEQVIAKAVARAQKPQNKAGLPAYTYTKVTLTEEFDATGNVRERKEKVYQVFFESGATRVKLIEVNGRSP